MPSNTAQCRKPRPGLDPKDNKLRTWPDKGWGRVPQCLSARQGKLGPHIAVEDQGIRPKKQIFGATDMLFKGGDGLWIEMLTLLLLLLCLALQVDPPLIGCRRAGMEASCEQVSETRASMRHCGREGITCMSTCVCVHMCVAAFRLRCPATRHVSRVHPFLSQA